MTTRPFPTADQAGPATGPFALSGRAWGLLAAGMVLAAGLWQAFSPVDVDLAWLLTVDEKMLAGQRLYVDIFEVNPPFSALMYMPAVMLAGLTGVPAELIVVGLVLVATCASVGLALQILDPLLETGQRRWRAAAVLVFVLAVFPTGVFGQREQIAVVALAPFVALAAARRAGAAPAARWAALAGLGAGIAMSIKPHFALWAGFPLLLNAWTARSPRPLFRLETWTASGVVALYAAVVVLAFPAFLTDFVPVVRDSYLATRQPLTTLLTLPPCLALLVFLGLAWVGARAGPNTPGRMAPWLAACLGGVATFLIQGKGWPYQAYPMLAFGLLAAVSPTATFAKGWPARSLLAMSVLISMAWFTVKGDYHQLREPVARITPHPRMLTITSDIALGHPLVRQLHGQWVGSSCAQWATAAVLKREASHPASSQLQARLDRIVQLDRARLAADIHRGRPDIILIDQQYYDWGRWAMADPQVARELAGYSQVETIDHIAIWRRLPGAKG